MVIEHIIAGYSVPHNEGAIPLTKESYSINDPQKRLTDFSKTITLPEDNRTNQIFEHCFDVNVAFQTFNPNKKTSYQIRQDGITLMNGYCQLKNIRNLDGRVVYEIVATGKTGNVFEQIKDLYLTDIDLSDLDHTWNSTNVVASWTPTLGEDYVYPMIDLGGRTNYDVWLVTDFKPAIFVKEYLTRIFSAAGYTISSDFFDTTLFKSLIIPYASDTILIDNSGIKDNTFSVGLTSTQVITTPTVIVWNNASAPYYNTSGNDFNTTTGAYLAPLSEEVSIQGEIVMSVKYTEASSIDTLGLNAIRILQGTKIYIQYYILENGLIAGSGVLDVTNDMSGVALTSIYTTSDFTVPFVTQKFSTVSGRSYTMRIDPTVIYTNGSTILKYTSSWNLNIKIGSNIQLNILRTTLVAGDTIVMNNVIPKQIKQTDFVAAIIKRFNLYLDYDLIDDTIIYIEPREDYLTATSEDLSEMVDRSKDYIIKPLGALDSNVYKFTDKEDKDLINTQYQTSFTETYGTRTYTVDNDFIKSEKVITSIFSPTPLMSVTNENDRVISSIQFQDEQQNKIEGQGAIRLLYWGGLLATKKKWSLTAFPFTLRSTYPYAGHIDNPFSPTFDLNWNVPKRIYYDFRYGGSRVVTYTNNNVYNVFWSKYIQEITDKDSKLLECYLWLRPNDYERLSFRNRYYIDGSFWRLLKIEDYEVTANQTTKCIFLKAAPQSAFTPEAPEVLGGGGEVYSDGQGLPLMRAFDRPNNSSGVAQDSIIYGDNNTSVNRSIIVSNDVLTAAGSTNITALNSDGSTLQGSNIVVINSPDVTANAGEVYINSLYAENLFKRTYSEADGSLGQLFSTGQVILPELESNQAYEVIRGYARLTGSVSGGSHKLEVFNNGATHSLAEIPSAFFSTSNNVGYFDLTHAHSDIHLGDDLFMQFAGEMTFSAGATLEVQIIYRIVTI